MMIMIPEGGGGGGGRWKPPRGTGHDDVMIKKTTMKTISILPKLPRGSILVK